MDGAGTPPSPMRGLGLFFGLAALLGNVLGLRDHVLHIFLHRLHLGENGVLDVHAAAEKVRCLLYTSRCV